MATTHFGATDFKVFSPISTALANLPNGAGTMIFLFKRTTTGGTDLGGLRDNGSGAAEWYHALSHPSGGQPYDDAGAAGAPISNSTLTPDTTNWWFLAVDWASSAGATTERFHWRNQTSLGTWTHSAGSPDSGGNKTGPGTTGWFRIGHHGDETTAQKDMAVVAIWAGTRFADTDYGDFQKTSDLYNHALGHPTLLVELTAATLTDLIGGSTYDSTDSSGTALTGGTPPNWTFDGVGSGGGATVSAVPMAGSGDLIAPAVAASFTAAAVPMAGTGDLVAPTVAGSASQTVVAVPMAASGDIPATAVSAGATVTAVPMAGTGDVPPANSIVSAVVNAPTMAGTGGMAAPAVSAGANGSVTAPPLAGSGDLVAPVAAAGSAVTALPLAGTGDLVAPAASGTSAGNVAAAPMAGSGDLVAPTVSGSSAGQVIAVPFAAIGSLATPALSANATIAATVAAGSGDLAAPVFSTPAVVTAAPFTGTGDLVTPVLSWTANLTVPKLAGTGYFAVPSTGTLDNAPIGLIEGDGMASGLIDSTPMLIGMVE